MNLSEAIRHCEEVADKLDARKKVYENLEDDRRLFAKEESDCRECVEEHRQLATWLKDYKRLLESCEDAVSREDVIKSIQRHAKRYSLAKESEGMGVEEWSDHLISEFDITKTIEALKPVVPKQKWIPTSEKSPSRSGVYIVSRWFSDGEVNKVLTDANYYDGNGNWYSDNRINEGRTISALSIVAWMPMPDPY